MNKIRNCLHNIRAKLHWWFFYPSDIVEITLFIIAYLAYIVGYGALIIYVLYIANHFIVKYW